MLQLKELRPYPPDGGAALSAREMSESARVHSAVPTVAQAARSRTL